MTFYIKYSIPFLFDIPLTVINAIFLHCLNMQDAKDFVCAREGDVEF